MEITKTLRTSVLSTAIVAGILAAPLAASANELHLEWLQQNGKSYWVEYGVIQGTADDPKGVKDTQYNKTVRGREIYDPASDGWYWLDAKYNGAKAVAKEVWMPYVFQDEKPGSTDGKWVMYDNNGKMVKGWLYRADKDAWYYYDLKTGAMAKDWKIIGDHDYGYRFDKKTGVMVDDFGNKIGYTKGWSMVVHSMQKYEIYYSLDTLPDGSWLIQANVVWPGQLPQGCE